VEGQGGDLGVLPVGAGEIAALAVEVALAESSLHDLQAIVDLPPQRGIGAVVADEEGADHVAEFLDGLVGGVLGAAGGPKICWASAVPSRSAVAYLTIWSY
jgi:hypothetical protein